MANLVSPGYDKSRLINSILSPYEERTLEFRGLNRRSYVEEGEMSDMRNMTSDGYPLLKTRQRRRMEIRPDGVVEIYSLMGKYGKAAMIVKKSDESVAFYYDGTEVWSVDDLTADTQMVAINNKICFFPQKTYLDFYTDINGVQHPNTYRDLEAKYTTTASYPTWAVTMSASKTTVKVPPMAYNDSAMLEINDAVNITGFIRYKPQGSSNFTSQALNVSCVINNITNDGTPGYVLELPGNTFIELVGQGATDISIIGVSTGGGDHDPAQITRECPDMKHIIEWNNRLWGVSDKDNVVYACKLGDPTNWQYYQGTSLDSYYAQQGTDGKWTGAAAYSGHLIFFKENSMTKIYGTAPANFQVTNAICYGVKEGNEKSVAIINDTVFYNSSIGIMAYEGGTPYSISTKLNRDYTRVIAGTEGRKYYASCQYEAVGGYQYELLVLDVDRAVWHREGEENIRQFANIAGKLIGVMEHSASDPSTIGVMVTVNPDTPNESSQARVWSVTFGPFDENVEDQKIFSKISLRFIVGENASATVYIKMDDGEWEQIREFPSTTIDTGGEVVRIVPRRCDRFSIKLSGTGEIEIKSLTRRFRRGSEVRYGHNIRSTT